MNILYLLHLQGDRESRVADLLAARGCTVEFRCHEAGDPLPHHRAFDGVVVGGGHVSVWESEEHPFMAREIEFVRQVVDAGVPYLGVCLGSQILAAAYGTTSAPRSDEFAEMGFFAIEPTPAGAELFEGLEHVYQVHFESTIELPKGAELLASSELFEVQAFRVGAHAYGLQFHPDARADMVSDWWDRYEVCRKRRGAQSLAEQLELAARYEPERRTWLEGFIDKWLATNPVLQVS